MAKTARRSVASDPPSPKLPYEAAEIPLHNHHHHHSNNTPEDPLRQSSGSLYTTQTIPNFNNNTVNKNTSSPYGSGQYENATTNRTSEQFRLERVAAERERVRMEFFATYDVMTGVRIAATLAGFFGLMVFLVVYKSRGESQETIKALKDPKIAAVAAAVMQEEEDRELQEAMEATGMSIYPDEYEHIGFRRERLMSVGNVSAPPVLHRYRFSSLGGGGGGYSSLLQGGGSGGPSQRRFSSSAESRRKSTSESSRILSAYQMGGSFGIDDYFQESDGDEADDEFDQLTNSVDMEKSPIYLSVPLKGQESRRSSSITCCSTDSSYLERRCSAVTLGLTPLPPASSNNPSRRHSTRVDNWDYYYPGIQVIQPTPRTSPVPSEKNIYEKRKIDRHKSLSTEQDTYDNISEYPADVDEKKFPSSASATTMTENNTTNYNKTNVNSYNNINNNNKVDVSVDTFSSHLIRRAPLASLSSFKISSIDYQDSDLRSLGSDSVFAESYDADTDDEMEQFSTDTDEISDGAQSPPNTRNTTPRKFLTYPSTVPSTSTTIHITNEKRQAQSDVDVDKSNRNIGFDLRTKINSSYVGKKKMSKSNSEHLGHTFETKVTIERHYNKTPPISNVVIGPMTQSSSSSSASLVRKNSKSLATSSPAAAPSPSSLSRRPSDNYSAATIMTGMPNASFSNNLINNKNSNQNINKSINQSSECVDINVVVVDNNSRSIVSPSVILELPVISTQEDDIIDPPIDPSLPGTSRKWSKETLF